MQLPSAETLDDVPENYSLAEFTTEPQLVVALEGDRPLSGGARYSLAGVHEVIIGRGAERHAERQTRDGLTTLHLKLPARSLSTVHARVVRVNQQWILEDAQSRNGSFMNGQQVQSAAWLDHDVVQLGHVFFLLRSAMVVDDHTPEALDAAELTRAHPGLRTLLPRLARGFDGLVRVARSQVPLLLLGETGTGKELLAQAVHGALARAGGFVAVNCGALPEATVEAQLFGSTPGAAGGEGLGYLRAAHQGTLFLDEVGDLRGTAQAALLRALERGEVVPLGDTRSVSVNLLLISASHRALDAATLPAALRQDLLARLSGYTLTLPPLRERLEDLGLMIASILSASGDERAAQVRFSANAGTAFFAYAWPLNVRELQHVLLSSVALSRDGVIHLSHLPAPMAQTAPGRPPQTPEPQVSPDALTDEERRLRAALLAQLRQHYGNVAAVGRAMHKAPMQVHRWMKRFGIDPIEFRNAAKKAR